MFFSLKNAQKPGAEVTLGDLRNLLDLRAEIREMIIKHAIISEPIDPCETARF